MIFLDQLLTAVESSARGHRSGQQVGLCAGFLRAAWLQLTCVLGEGAGVQLHLVSGDTLHTAKLLGACCASQGCPSCQAGRSWPAGQGAALRCPCIVPSLASPAQSTLTA